MRRAAGEQRGPGAIYLAKTRIMRLRQKPHFARCSCSKRHYGHKGCVLADGTRAIAKFLGDEVTEDAALLSLIVTGHGRLPLPHEQGIFFSRATRTRARRDALGKFQD